MERRKGDLRRSSPLPADYLKMVAEVFTTNFDAGLQALQGQVNGKLFFEASGGVFVDEVVLAISLLEEDQLAATTFYASTDFDPKASTPTVQDLLSACVDAIGLVFDPLLDPEKPETLEQLASHSLSALDNIPFHWTEVKQERYRIFIKMDKANPHLEHLANEWLRQNDPSALAEESEDHEATEKLFVTGPSNKTRH
ncbi:hypothetical protein WDW37_00470 [Bdellovibrionota bacterium FG-1]